MWSNFTFRSSKREDPGKDKPSPTPPNWWKSGSVYQIWPRSFKDSNGDGIGDIPGILSKLDYLQDLGVEIIWLSPMYDSPQADMGYDISDYESVYPAYGTLEDMDKLISGLHDRGMRLLLDLVINHTSDQHKWFLESMKSKNNPKSDWYIWKDPKIVKGVRAPPNNWISSFRGSAWEWCKEREQYYLHIFAKGQPDLNWENPTTRQAIFDSSMKFWFEKGIDGFRIDTANLYSKNQAFPDGPVTDRSKPYGEAYPFVANGPRIHEFYRQIRREVLDKYVGGDPMMVGELGGCTFQQILKYVVSDRKELSMVFDFDVCFLGGMMRLPKHEVHDYPLPDLKTALEKTQDLVANTKAWSTIFFENHDNPRSINHHGSKNPKYYAKSAKVLAMLLNTLSGTLFRYQGEEIGMTNFPATWSPSDLRDIDSLNYWAEMKALYPHNKEMLARAWSGIVRTSRDNARTPVQWSSEPHAGFTSGLTTWMRVNENYKHINAADQQGVEGSVLEFWKRMLRVRKSYAGLLVEGHYEVHDFGNLKTFTFVKRTPEGKVALVVLNFSEEECGVDVPKELEEVEWELLVSSDGEVGGKLFGKLVGGKLGGKLAPWEGRLYVEKGNKGDALVDGEGGGGGDEDRGYVFV